MELFCGIMCIPYQDRKKIINYQINELGLTNFKNVNSIELSGGNKRKLCVAIAMLGNNNY